jgi:chromosome segregation ATPase
MKQLQSQHDKNSINVKNIFDKINCLQKDNNLFESYEWICQRLKSDQSSLESANNQIKYDSESHKLDNGIDCLEKQILKYTKQIDLTADLTKLRTEKDELIKTIQTLKDKINGDMFQDRKKQLIKDLDNSSVTGLIGVASALKETYFSPTKSKELADIKETEESLKQKEKRFSVVQSKINENDATIISGQDNNTLLTECKTSLEKLKIDKKNRISELKNNLQTDKLEQNISKFKRLKEIKEKINDHEEKIKKIQQENIQIELEICRLKAAIPIEQCNIICYDDRCKLLQHELIVAEQELNYNKMEAEKEYNETSHQIEYNRKIQKIDLDGKQQKEINEVINDFKMKIKSQ